MVLLRQNWACELQRVQNTAARLVFNLSKYDRIYNSCTRVTLHWLPVKYRIEFKTLLIVFKGFHGKAPTYILEMITPSKSKRYSIRANEERVLKVPEFKHDTFGKRAFAVYGPLPWNCLPKEIRLCDEIEAFKRNIKTNLFVKFVNESTLAIWFWRIIVKRPRMLSAQFVALYKPCKPRHKSTWLRHQVETFSALLALCAGNSSVTGEFPSQRPLTRSLDIFFDLRLNKRTMVGYTHLHVNIIYIYTTKFVIYKNFNEVVTYITSCHAIS